MSRLTEGVHPTRYVVSPTQPTVTFARPTPAPKEDWTAHTTRGTLPMTAQVDNNKYCHDAVRFAPIAACEARHWDKFSLQASRGSPLLLPNVPGNICCVRLFAHAIATSSLLMCGTDQGQLAVYMVPWTGSAPVLLSVTPVLPQRQRSAVIDVRDASTSALQMLTVHLNGHIRVWSLPPAAAGAGGGGSGSGGGGGAAAAHSKRMFPKDANRFEVTVPSCVFHVNPLDMSMPVPLDPTGRATAAAATALARSRQGRKQKKVRKSALGETAFDDQAGLFSRPLQPQMDMFPSCAAFHPSITITGRNSSIVVGSVGGDLVKFNMDFKVCVGIWEGLGEYVYVMS